MTERKKTTESPIQQALSAISLDGLVAGFRTYLDTWRNVLTKRGQLAVFAGQDEAPISFKTSVAVYLYGVALSFILYLPLIQIYGLPLPKLYFLLQFVYLQVVYVLLTHLSAKAVRGNGSIKDTAGALCTWIGICSPPVFLLAYPLFVFVPTVDFVGQSSQPHTVIPQWAVIAVSVTFVAMMVAFFLMPLRWIATVHRVKFRWMLLGIFLVLFPLMGLHNYFIAPYVAKILKLTSDFLEKLA